MPRKRTYRVFMTYDQVCFSTRYPNTTSKQAAVAEATTEFLQYLVEQGYGDVQPSKLVAEVEVYKGEKDGTPGI